MPNTYREGKGVQKDLTEAAKGMHASASQGYGNGLTEVNQKRLETLLSASELAQANIIGNNLRKGMLFPFQTQK